MQRIEPAAPAPNREEVAPSAAPTPEAAPSVSADASSSAKPLILLDQAQNANRASERWEADSTARFDRRPAEEQQSRDAAASAPPAAGTLNETITLSKQESSPTLRAAGVSGPPPLWRWHGSRIERSVDQGASWTTQYDARQTVLAGVAVDADVAWFVGVRGLVVRRTAAGWSIVTAPADGDVVAIQATSDREATVTVADKRRFRTSDGGVTWR